MAETTNTSQQLPPKPSFGFFVAYLRAHGKDSLADGVLKEVSRQGAEDFSLKREAMLAAIDIPRRSPAERLAFYLSKPEPLWQELYAKFPNEYEEDWRDFEKLRERAKKGDFTPQLAAQVLLYEADRRREAVQQGLVGLFNG